ncbi:hypothetical protein EVJ58_g9046 [Rhodofomes roseus]|uniref:Leucine rich repeat (LRR) protein n=1 Tax=Rhodofomes roseus TaxID=34475 RepID=A0A4Y9XVE9_9APHY|nr:hypothetical protein EVJ58_g9046 [Rhodofomes roseus]
MDRPVSEKERERFLWYTQCIHIINLQASRRVDPWVFFRLSQENLGMPLAPRLHTMICNQDWPYIDMVVSLLSGPSLRTLALKFNGPEWTIDDDRKLPLNRHNYAAYPLLRNVCASAPDLEKLTVYMCAYPGLLHPIGGMKRLRVLDLSLVWTPINMELVRQLAQLEQLEELALHNSFDGRNLGPCEGFKSVTKLIIRGGIRTIPPLLQALPDLHLRELHLNSPVIEELRPLQKLVSALSLASRESIESVRMDSLTAGRSLTSAPVSTLIAPFFALPNIRSFYLRADDPLCIADDDLRVIGGKWAKLEDLRLVCNASSTHATAVAPTMQGIIELANLCTQLDHVRFSSVIPSESLGFINPHWVEGVRELPLDIQVPDCDIHDVHQVARVLWWIFRGLHVPNLDRLAFKKWAAVLDGIARLETERRDRGATQRWSM